MDRRRQHFLFDFERWKNKNLETLETAELFERRTGDQWSEFCNVISLSGELIGFRAAKTLMAHHKNLQWSSHSISDEGKGSNDGVTAFFEIRIFAIKGEE